MARNRIAEWTPLRPDHPLQSVELLRRQVPLLAVRAAVAAALTPSGHAMLRLLCGTLARVRGFPQGCQGRLMIGKAEFSGHLAVPLRHKRFASAGHAALPPSPGAASRRLKVLVGATDGDHRLPRAVVVVDDVVDRAGVAAQPGPIAIDQWCLNRPGESGDSVSGETYATVVSAWAQ